MTTRSRARMFHATARALRAAEDSRHDATGMLLAAQVEDVDLAGIDLSQFASLTIAEPAGVSSLIGTGAAINAVELERLHSEFRWADSKLMQASERLAEAQEARRKDLVALASMRRALHSSFDAERDYVLGQLQLLRGALPRLEQRERELEVLVEEGATTHAVITELASVRAERKLVELGIGQAESQLAGIDESAMTLEYEVASETYDREPDGRMMRELARLRSESTGRRRAAARARAAARELMGVLGIDTTHGEVAAIASFLAAEFEGDQRGIQRMERVRGAQVAAELAVLPSPTSSWKAGLRHPMSVIRSRRVTGG